MKKLLLKTNTNELLQEAAELLKAAFSSNNMEQKYTLYKEAEDLKKIAKIIYKWEEMQQKMDL